MSSSLPSPPVPPAPAEALRSAARDSAHRRRWNGEPSSYGLRPPLERRLLLPLSAHLVVALVALVVIGGATRVMEAGLACPDWPLCYGTLLPGRQMNVQVFLEWFHRLDAFLVGIGLLLLEVIVLRLRRDLPAWLPWSCGAALLLVGVQGGLGALTVLQLLASSIVTAHLVTALCLVALLSGIHQALEISLAGGAADPTSAPRPSPLPAWWMVLLALATVAVLGQCLLGGVMASQWSAERCLAEGISCSRLLIHRLGAWPAGGSLILLALGVPFLPPAGRTPQAILCATALGLAGLQIALGVTTLRLQLQVPAATVSHQLVAALLVALLGALWGRSVLVAAGSPGSIPPQDPHHG